jgi:uncharacterized protein (TIGR02265 family)
MKVSVQSASQGHDGGAAAVSQAGGWAARVTSSPREQAIVERNLAGFPPEVRVRGVFFVGISEIVARSKGPAALAEIKRAAGTPDHVVAFRQYPHADFYRFYYVAARALHPNVPLPTALRLVARSFFPIFRESLLGKTMSALMGTEPKTLLPLLPRAYNLSVEGTHHEAEVVGERAIVWRARAEAVTWYEETFQGIIEGTAPPAAPLADDGARPWSSRLRGSAADRATIAPVSLAVTTVSKTVDGKLADYVFQITW